jgi:hypothetical protein
LSADEWQDGRDGGQRNGAAREHVKHGRPPDGVASGAATDAGEQSTARRRGRIRRAWAGRCAPPCRAPPRPPP